MPSWRSAPRILVVDDNEDLHRLVSLLFQRYLGDASVMTAASAAEALARLEEAHREPDVAVIDERLGPDDGLALAAALVERWPRLPIIVFTGAALPEVTHRIRESGLAVQAVVGKLELERLPQIVERLLQPPEELEVAE